MISQSVEIFLQKKMKTRGVLFFSLLVIFGMVLSSCGGAGANHAGSSNALTIQTGPDGDYTQAFSPFITNPTPGTLGMVYEPLLMFNRLNGTVQPWLASSYKFSTDAKTLTFTIRQGVKWSNGQAFTANDAAFTFNLLKKYPAADTNNLWHYLQSVTAPNASTLVLMLKQPYSPILWYAGGQTYMVPQSQWANVGDPTKYSNPKPVGTGPFMLDTFAPQLVTYKKNTNYWQPGKPQVNELRYPAYDSNQSVELDLDQGNLDWVGLFTPDVQKTYVSRDPAHNHYWAPLNSPTVLFMNLTKAPFNQQAVRQAINGALDREAMSTTAESGYDPPASPTGLVLPNQQSYLAPQYTNLKTTVDPAKSIALLQSAGFIRGANGIFQDKSGKPLSFSLDVVTGWTDWITMGQIIATNLKAIGINITVNTLAFSAYASALQTGNYQMGLGSVSAGPTPYFFYNALLNGQNAATPNDERWNDARTNQLLDQFATTTNPTEQKQAIQGLEQIMVQQVPVIMLVNASYLTEYSSTRFTGWPDQSNPYAVPDPWEQPDCETIVLNLKPVA